MKKTNFYILVICFLAVIFATPFVILNWPVKMVKVVHAAEAVKADPVLTPHRTEVYFLIPNTKNCGLVAYVPEGSVCVSVKVSPKVSKPYIEVSRQIYRDPTGFRSSRTGEVYIAWALGGTLYVKDIQQVKDLLLVNLERD